jgi:hypothetical protein
VCVCVCVCMCAFIERVTSSVVCDDVCVCVKRDNKVWA